MKRVDFKKPLVCSNDAYEVIAVLNVNYSNSMFKHCCHIRDTRSGEEFTPSVNVYGEISSGTPLHGAFAICNPEPVVIKKIYTPVLASGYAAPFCYGSFEEAIAVNLVSETIALLLSKYYDNGNVTVELITDLTVGQ
jgi:hypothetical protein